MLVAQNGASAFAFSLAVTFPVASAGQKPGGSAEALPHEEGA